MDVQQCDTIGLGRIPAPSRSVKQECGLQSTFVHSNSRVCISACFHCYTVHPSFLPALSSKDQELQHQPWKQQPFRDSTKLQLYKIKIALLKSHMSLFHLCHHDLSVTRLCIYLSISISTTPCFFSVICVSIISVSISSVSAPSSGSPSLPLSYLFIYLPFLGPSLTESLASGSVILSSIKSSTVPSGPWADLDYCACYGQMLFNGMTAAGKNSIDKEEKPRAHSGAPG